MQLFSSDVVGGERTGGCCRSTFASSISTAIGGRSGFLLCLAGVAANFY